MKSAKSCRCRRSPPCLAPSRGCSAWPTCAVDLKQFLEGERTVLHESQRCLLVRQPGGDVAVLIDELFGQRSFTEPQKVADLQAADDPLYQGRYAHFVDVAYRVDQQPWGIFSLDRLARTPEFRQAAG